MPDRESVITHLQIIHTWASFARKRDLQFFTAKHLEDIAQWSDDAIELLKEQGAQKFFVDKNGKITPLPIVFPNCPLKEREARWISVPHKRARICSHCEADEPYKSAEDDAEVYEYCPHCGAKMTEGR